FTPSKPAAVAAAFLEALAGAARAEVVAAELFGQLFVAVNDAHAALHFRLGREALAALAHRFEKNAWCSRTCGSMVHRLSAFGRDGEMTVRVRSERRQCSSDKALSVTVLSKSSVLMLFVLVIRVSLIIVSTHTVLPSAVCRRFNGLLRRIIPPE